MKENIVIHGAREHNLRNIDLTIPRNKLVVITGVSGSGKSSLAYNTIYAEGQRKYVESLSAYARQFLQQLKKPEVEHIEGLSPAIAIEQRNISGNPRSTVATTTEIHDYMRLLYANVGTPHCHKCGKEVSFQTIQEIVEQIMQLPEGTRAQVLAPMVRGRKGEHKDILDQLRKDGFVRVRVDGDVNDLAEKIKLDKKLNHDIEAVVDRLVIKESARSRLADSVETALRLGQGIIYIVVGKEQLLYSVLNACVECGVSFEKLAPRMFSFNSPHGACKNCHGLGMVETIDPDLAVPDKSRSLRDYAISPWQRRGKALTYHYNNMIEGLAATYDIPMNVPFRDLPEKIQNIILYGSGSKKIEISFFQGAKKVTRKRVFEGVVPNLERRYRETESSFVRKWLREFMNVIECPSCHGNRLRPESVAVTIDDKSIVEVLAKTVRESIDFFENLKLGEKKFEIAKEIIKEILARLRFMNNVGVDYIALDRSSNTLSGGEAQRIRLATQIGAGLVGVLYILDEPSIGLHQRDNRRLLNTLCKMRDLGNTVIVIEHDEETIRSADYIVDLGPGAGVHGGEVVAAGPVEKIIKKKRSITGKYLTGELEIEIPKKRKKAKKDERLKIVGAREHNLKNLDIDIPLGLFTCVTGVSGSGKSTLVFAILDKGMRKLLYGSRLKPGDHDSIVGFDKIDKVIVIDQSPIGRTPRSNPATYTGVFTHVRDLFAKLPESRMRGYLPGRFSFNVKGGRCEACTGDGIKKIEMHFLPDVFVECEVCSGTRYNKESLEIKYKGKNIHDVLNMTVEESLEFFRNIPKIRQKLKTLSDVGMDYIELGQPATTLSGGEAQRIKLSAELSKRETGRTLYLLDEPTTGLHFADIEKLLDVLKRLTKLGNTVVVIEHNLDVIKTADHIIDLGPEGGDDGGMIVAQGTPDQVAATAGSFTGEFLKNIMDKQKTTASAK
jgi:excinuclease ABC subunit A